MKFLEKVENYFNSGSTDKINKRRLGGLLIGITAILLVISMVVLAAAAIITGIGNIVDANKEDEPVDYTSNLDPVSGTDVKALATGTIVLDERDLAASATLKSLTQTNRAFTTDDNIYNKDATNIIYGVGGGLTSGNIAFLQQEALTAFNAMMKKFYLEKGLATIYVVAAYENNQGNIKATGYYKNALSLKINYISGAFGNKDYKDEGSIYDVEEYEWIYQNAYKYGFVQVSDAENETNIFQYVGFAHARYIRDKQKSSKENFYSIDDYLAELKAATAEKPLTVTNAQTFDEKGEIVKSTKYFSYYMAADTADDAWKLPKEGFEYTVTETLDGGFIVTYCKEVKQ